MIVAGRVSQKMAPVLRQIYDQMPEPKWVHRDGRLRQLAAACSTTTRSSRASTTSSPSTSTCPAARRGPRCCIDAILKLHEQIQNTKLGVNRVAAARAAEEAGARRAMPTSPDEGAAAMSDRRQGARRTTPRGDRRRPSRRDRAVPPENAPAAPQRRGPEVGRRPARHVRRPRHRRHLRLRRPGPPGRAARRASQRPYGGWFDEVADALEARPRGDRRPARRAIEQVVVAPRRDHLPRPPRATCVAVAQVLRDDPALRFELCSGV